MNDRLPLPEAIVELGHAILGALASVRLVVQRLWPGGQLQRIDELQRAVRAPAPIPPVLSMPEDRCIGRAARGTGRQCVHGLPFYTQSIIRLGEAYARARAAPEAAPAGRLASRHRTSLRTSPTRNVSSSQLA